MQVRGTTYNVQIPNNPLNTQSAQENGIADPLNLLRQYNVFHPPGQSYSGDSYYLGSWMNFVGVDPGHVVNGANGDPGVEAHYDTFGPFNPLHWLYEAIPGSLYKGPIQQYVCSVTYGCSQP